MVSENLWLFNYIKVSLVILDNIVLSLRLIVLVEYIWMSVDFKFEHCNVI